MSENNRENFSELFAKIDFENDAQILEHLDKINSGFEEIWDNLLSFPKKYPVAMANPFCSKTKIKTK